MRPGPVIRTAGGGRSFPPAAGSFRTVRRLTCFASSTSSYQSAPPTAWRPPPVRSLFAMIIARSRGALTVKSMVKSKERKPGRRARRRRNVVQTRYSLAVAKANRRHTQWCAQQVGTHVLH